MKSARYFWVLNRKGDVMEQFSNDGFTLDRIREIDMAGYLERLGHSPVVVKKNGTDFWYLSPLRNEGEASFHVNLLTNRWYDFGLAAGGNMVDFCLRYYGCAIRGLADKFNADFAVKPLPVFNSEQHEGRFGPENKLVVTKVRPLYAYPLKNYLHERSIPVAVAELFCKEVSYRIGDRNYYGIGFQNDSGGYEIRNKNCKLSSSPKDITTLRYPVPQVQVFEGFMDFLSYQTLFPNMEPERMAFVVLNGAGMLDRALPYLDQFERIGLWLDRDVTGRAYTQYALSRGERYQDESALYHKFKDLNDWLRCKGEVKKPVLKLGGGLRGAI